VDKSDKYVKIAMVLSVVYVAASFFLEKQIASVLKNQMPLLGVTALFAVVNIGLLFLCFFRKKTISVSMVLLNIVQLAVFLRLHIQIHDILNASHYAYAVSPSLADWAKFIALYVIRAVDLPDLMEAYGILNLPFFQNMSVISHKGFISGIALFIMSLTLAIFTAAAIFKAVRIRAKAQESFAAVRWLGIGGLTLSVMAIAVLGWIDNWSLKKWLLWPVENVLCALDIGDALQIFSWQFQTPEMDMTLASVAVIFRIIAGCYVLALANYLYARVSESRQSAAELGKICLSAEHSPEERLSAIKKLEELGTFAEEALPYLIKVLADSSNDIRIAALGALGEINAEWTQTEAAKSAVPDLLKGLADADKGIRSASAETLDRIDPEWHQSDAAKSAIPNFVNALFEKDKDVRIAGADALGKIGAAAEKSVSHLLKLLSDENKEVRTAAVAAMGNIGPPEEVTPHLIKTLADSDNDVRKAAIKALGNFGPTATPQLVDVLADSDEDIRRSAAETLEKTDPQWRKSESARKAAERFLKVMADSFSSERGAAVEALGVFGMKGLLPHLVSVLADASPEVRKAAQHAVEKIDPKWHENENTRKAIPAFLKAMVNNDTEVRETGKAMLKKIDPKWYKSEIAVKAIPMFVKALESKLGTVRKDAAAALGDIGPGAAKAVPYLIKLSAERDEEVRGAAVAALEKINPLWQGSKSTSEVVPRFVKELENEDWRVRTSAATALGEIESASANAILKLMRMLTDKDRDVRKSVRASLEKIDPDWRKNKEVHRFLPHIVKALAHDNWAVRIAAVEALGELETPAETTAPHIVKALKDSTVDVRNAAEAVLKKIDPEGNFREQVITKRYIPSATEKALEGIEPDSPDAIPHLVKKLTDTDRAVRNAAKSALEELDPKWRKNKSALAVIPYIVKEGLSDSRWIVRVSSAEAIGEFGPVAGKLAPRLAKIMATDSSMDVRSAAKKALAKIS
jgi:HEAT repeat protein